MALDIERLLTLAREEAFNKHAHYSLDVDKHGHVQGMNDSEWGFSACPHPDCVLIRTDVERLRVSSRSPELVRELQAVWNRLPEEYRYPEMLDVIDALASRSLETETRLCSFCLFGEPGVKHHSLCDGWRRHGGKVEPCECPCVASRASARQRRTALAAEAKYYELIYAVETVHQGESRHETALRYIRQAEQRTGGPASEVKVP